MITIVDYGMGNLGSLVNMYKRIGVTVQVCDKPEEIARAKKLLLPGVGAFDAAMSRIAEIEGLIDVLNHKALIEKIPLLGICLGMQLLTDCSEEGQLRGLGYIPGKTIRFSTENGLKVPHMGWNHIKEVNPSILTERLPEEPRFYFVHSYYVQVTNPTHRVTKTHYELDFDSIIQRDNIFGAQFHPEKSHKFGMELLTNFAKL
jgi:glutamine amidotransferase